MKHPQVNDSPRAIALGATIFTVVVILLWLLFTNLGLRKFNDEWPPKHTADITIEEEFVEVLEQPRESGEEAKAFDETEESNMSTPSPEGGVDSKNTGVQGEPAPTVASDRPSPVKETVKPKPKNEGPAVDQLEAEREKARRKAGSTLGSAFAATGKNNTSNSGKKEGNSGNPDGAAGEINGRVAGNAGHGWGLPGYGLITSPVTGTVKAKVTIGSKGEVKAIEFIGGTPPAGSNPQAKAAVEREIRRHKFHRSDDNPPEEATAFITVTF